MSTTGQMVAVCPHCRKSYAVRAEQAGRSAKCRQCGEAFTIEPQGAEAAVAVAVPPVAAPGGSAEPGLLCPICQSAVGGGEKLTRCPECQTAHHADCWDYNKGCGLYGCKQSPETEKLRDVEIPASYWGQTEKKCPRCGGAIQAAAVRCRHCGEQFNTARPQAMGEYAMEQQQKSAADVHRKIGVAFLVFAIFPCTAPLTAVASPIWYFTARRNIAAMPPLHATLCRLAVGISIGVTVLLIVLAAFYGAFHSTGAAS